MCDVFPSETYYKMPALGNLAGVKANIVEQSIRFVEEKAVIQRKGEPKVLLEHLGEHCWPALQQTLVGVNEV